MFTRKSDPSYNTSGDTSMDTGTTGYGGGQGTRGPGGTGDVPVTSRGGDNYPTSGIGAGRDPQGTTDTGQFGEDKDTGFVTAAGESERRGTRGGGQGGYGGQGGGYSEQGGGYGGQSGYSGQGGYGEQGSYGGQGGYGRQEGYGRQGGYGEST